MKEDYDDEILDMALRMIGFNTSQFTRDIFVETLDSVRDLKEAFSIRDYTRIKSKMCEKHGLDFDTLTPIKHKDRKIFVAKPSKNGFKYKTFEDEYTEDVEKAHDYKSFSFAEKMVIQKEIKGVMIITYYG